MTRALAFLAGLGAGYQEKQDKDRRQAREDKLDARADEQYAFNKSERDRTIADRDAIRASAEPIPVTEEPSVSPELDPRDGLPGQAPTVYKAGAQSFASRGVADASAVTQREQNVTSALDRVDPAGATSRKSARAAAATNEAQLRKLTEEMIRENTLGALGAAIHGTPEDVKAAYNQAGKGRVADLTVEPYEIDHPTMGKIKTARIRGKMEDGTPIEVNDAFNQAFQLQGFAKRLGIETDWQKMADTKADKTAHNKRGDRQLDILQGQRDEQARHGRAMEGIAASHAKAAAAGAGAPTVTLKDKRDFENDFRSGIKDAHPISEGATPAERQAILSKRSEQEAAGNALFDINAQHGSPMTSGTMLHAMKLAENPKAHVPIQARDGKTYAGVMVNGQPIIIGGELRPRPPPVPVAPAAPGTPGGRLTGTTVGEIQRQLGAPPAARQAVVPAGAAPRQTLPDDGPAAANLDMARSALAAASQRLSSYGSQQRSVDPRGFAIAQQTLQMAKQAEQAALMEYQSSLGAMPSVARRP